MIGVQIKGDRELVRTLGRMPVRVQKQIARKALRPGATTLSRALKAAVPSISDEDARAMRGGFAHERDAGTGKAMQRLIKKGIKRRNKTYSNTGTVMIAVGPQFDFHGPGFNRSAGYFAQLLEFGTDDVPASPFLRTAASAVGQRAVSQVLERARAIVAEEARRA